MIKEENNETKYIIEIIINKETGKIITIKNHGIINDYSFTSSK